MLAIRAKYGWEPVLMSHDEIVLIVPEAEAEYAKEKCIEEMRIAPWWCPGIPLNAEAGIGQSYGEAK
jgi:DNA polymerase I-like protein with 3'-5' exonuclease and polymerase domains